MDLIPSSGNVGPPPVRRVNGERPYRLAVVNSHPIQYFAPLYRRIAREPDIQLTVFYCSRAGVDPYTDVGFGQETFSWDVPLLSGYQYSFLSNVGGERTPAGFWSLTNPSIVARILRGRFDAVWLSSHAYATCLLAILGAKVARTPLFMRCDTHLGLQRSRLRGTLRGPIMTAFYRLFAGCLAIGTRNAEFYRRHGVPPNKLFLVPFTVDNQRFREGAMGARARRAEVRQTLGLPLPGIPVVLYLSKLTARKRPMDLLRAYRRMRAQRNVAAALAVVGAGSERERLEQLVRDQDVPDVYFLGFRNQSELPTIYGACDIFVLPAENEPWGLVLNEAMCAGLPVVASDGVGAVEDLIREGENGFLYSVGDVELLERRLTQLASDGALRDRMGRKSIEIMGRWDLDACVAGVRAALRAVRGCSLARDQCAATDVQG